LAVALLLDAAAVLSPLAATRRELRPNVSVALFLAGSIGRGVIAWLVADLVKRLSAHVVGPPAECVGAL
jgi:hypothetical protein